MYFSVQLRNLIMISGTIWHLSPRSHQIQNIQIQIQFVTKAKRIYAGGLFKKGLARPPNLHSPFKYPVV